MATCAATGCDATFASSRDASLHYALEHLGHGPRPTRPVSCWQCAAYIPTIRHPDNRVTCGPCPECGWLHPLALAAGVTK